MRPRVTKALKTKADKRREYQRKYRLRKKVGAPAAIGDLFTRPSLRTITVTAQGGDGGGSYDKINPPHYEAGSPLEVINIIEYYQLNFNLGNVCKYLLRLGKKPGEDKQTAID